jgi:hypothetical protein
MTRICLVKANTTYDLYKRTGPDLRAIVESSNYRSGPIGLWEAFDCDFRVLQEDTAPECQLGKESWAEFVKGWDIWPEGLKAERADEVDWSHYDLVISIDVAVPTRIVLGFPTVMWCYYWIEGGPPAIDTFAKGSPFFSYNVFISQRLAKARLSPGSPELSRMRRTKRAVLDAPYFLQSSRSIELLYADEATAPRGGVCLSDHSADVASSADLVGLEAFGAVRSPRGALRDVLLAKVRSKYFVVHPDSTPRCGNALIEAVSSGCLAVAPSRLQWGFPEIVSPGLDFSDARGMFRILEALEHDPELYESELAAQRSRIDDWCFSSPCRNLEQALHAFRRSPASRSAQRWAEAGSRLAVGAQRLPHRVARGLLKRS